MTCWACAGCMADIAVKTENAAVTATRRDSNRIELPPSFRRRILLPFVLQANMLRTPESRDKRAHSVLRKNQFSRALGRGCFEKLRSNAGSAHQAPTDHLVAVARARRVVRAAALRAGVRQPGLDETPRMA